MQWAFQRDAICCEVFLSLQQQHAKEVKKSNNQISYGYHCGVLNHILFVKQMKKLLQVIKIIESSMLSSSSPRGGNEIFPQGSSLSLAPLWPAQSLHCTLGRGPFKSDERDLTSRYVASGTSPFIASFWLAQCFYLVMAAPAGPHGPLHCNKLNT